MRQKTTKKILGFLRSRSKKQLLSYVLMIIALGIVTGGIFFLYLIKTLPSVEQIKAREMSQSTKIFDRNGALLYEFYTDCYS